MLLELHQLLDRFSLLVCQLSFLLVRIFVNPSPLGVPDCPGYPQLSLCQPVKYSDNFNNKVRRLLHMYLSLLWRIYLQTSMRVPLSLSWSRCWWLNLTQTGSEAWDWDWAVSGSWSRSNQREDYQRLENTTRAQKRQLCRLLTSTLSASNSVSCPSSVIVLYSYLQKNMYRIEGK